MKIRVNSLLLPLDADEGDIRAAAAKRAGLKQSEVSGVRIVRQSVDARHGVQLVYGVELETAEAVACDGMTVVRVIESKPEPVRFGTKPLASRPVIIGTGPAGLFAALTLARAGYEPLVLERGADVDERTDRVESFWNGGGLDVQTNVQFGEGGAGTFSDGKLTTRTSDARQAAILNDFVRFGAHPDILVKAKPHIGTDVLKQVVKNIRGEIVRLGGEVRFHACMDNLFTQNGRLRSISANGQELPCSALILAIGHSARDTYEMLAESEIALAAKPFSIGLRIEHPQTLIDQALYGSAAGHPKLWPAEYQLSCRTKTGRSCYSFCMCPGGTVVNASSEPDQLVTNGMSEYARARDNANSALCASVGLDDFEGSGPLAGVAFQRHWERMAFAAGGAGFAAPVQRVGDFLESRPSARLGTVRPSFTGNVTMAELHTCLPSAAAQSIEEGIRFFERRIRGFSNPDAVLTGVETRTSAPVRILRDEAHQSVSIRGLYPAGEGAGYAGGIMSAAVDGMKTAEKLMEEWIWKK